MAKPLTIDSAVLRQLREMPKADRINCLEALLRLSEMFGAPHRHAGVGIRKLGASLFECRAGLQLRFIVQNRSDDLYVSFLGNHDEVAKLLRSGRYPR